MAGRTVAQKIWDEHLIRSAEGEPDLLYIDLHLVHEVTSPQAFEGLRLTGRNVRRPDLTLATQDHNVPTDTRVEPFADPLSQQQVESLRANCQEFGVPLYDTLDPRQGIVHIIGPEQGLTQPGLTIVCGDSHTLDPRRAGRPRLRDRHLGGRACTRHPDPAAGAAQANVSRGHGRAARRPARPRT